MVAADFVAFVPLLATATNSLNRTPLAVESVRELWHIGEWFGRRIVEWFGRWQFGGSRLRRICATARDHDEQPK